jgi:hypothetical protein
VVVNDVKREGAFPEMLVAAETLSITRVFVEGTFGKLQVATPAPPAVHDAWNADRAAFWKSCCPRELNPNVLDASCSGTDPTLDGKVAFSSAALATFIVGVLSPTTFPGPPRVAFTLAVTGKGSDTKFAVLRCPMSTARVVPELKWPTKATATPRPRLSDNTLPRFFTRDSPIVFCQPNSLNPVPTVLLVRDFQAAGPGVSMLWHAFRGHLGVTS